jgi:heptosyltransferase-3
MAAMLDDAIPLAEVRRVLVIKLRHHGDVLLTSPVFNTLKAALPASEIDALVYADTCQMLEGHPAIAQLHGIVRGKKRSLWDEICTEWRLLRTLKQRRYDLVVHLTDHPRGGWMTRLMAPRWAVAPKRKGRFWKRTFTHQYSLPRQANRHTVEKNLDALRRIGLHPRDQDKRLCMVPGAAAEQRVGQLLAEHGVSDSFIHLHPASRWFFKCWPSERMAELVDALGADGHNIVVTGAPDARERAMIAEIRARSTAAWVDLSGQLSLREMAALSARARLFVGVDSAPMHIAAAVGTSVVALFGPSGELEWAPWGGQHRIVSSDQHTCRPCGMDGCGGSKVSDCLVTLPVARVLAACRQLL